MIQVSSKYNKSHPFLAKIKERYNLCKEGAEKNTFHVVLDLEDSDIVYQVGDSLAVQPTNDPIIVENILSLLAAKGHEIIFEKHTREPISLKDYLTNKLDLATVPRKLVLEMGKKQTHPSKKERLEFLLKEEQKESLKEYQKAHEVWDALAENEESKFSPEEFCHLLQPLLPRFYSIASSMKKVGQEVHLLVAELCYETNGFQRKGICTDYLCRRAPLDSSVIPVYLQPSHGFTLPHEDNVPIIMIGPGTGVAPFRAFMQERQVREAQGFNWLFFGERHRTTEFYYEKEWEEFAASEKFRLETAFSRDQEHKVYVQHKMLECGKEIFHFLENHALLYVCGDAKRMAKDVDAALHLMIQIHGNLSEAAAKDYVKKLRSEKRYLRDVY